MSKVAGLSWLASFGFARRGATPQTDFGDMGTAFGLDATLPTEPMPLETPPNLAQERISDRTPAHDIADRRRR